MRSLRWVSWVCLVGVIMAPPVMSWAMQGQAWPGRAANPEDLRSERDEDSKLERVEKEPDKKTHGESRPPVTHTSYYGSGYGSGSFLGTIFELLLGGLFLGLGDDVNWGERHAMLRREFHAALPTVRVEGAYQKLLGDDIQGYTMNATAGYMTFAADVDVVHYFETAPATQLKIISPHFLFRMAPTSVFQLDVALGAKILRGNRTHTGFEAGVPVYFFLGKHAILDLKMYEAFIGGSYTTDLALGISGKWKPLGVRASYRLMKIGSETLHGPTIGLFAQW